MITSPKYILTVYIPQYTGRSEVMDILKEYLEGMPHIKYEGHGSFTGTTYYILNNIAGFHNVLYNIASDMCTSRFIGYATYEHLRTKLGVTLYQKYSFSSTSNMLSLPIRLGITDSDLDKFIAIAEG